MKTVHVVGDSISIQYGPYLEKALGSDYVYSRKTGDTGNLDNPSGANGGDSSMVLQYLNWLLEKRYRTEILVLNCGLHDIKRYPVDDNTQISVEDYRNNIESIVIAAFKLCNSVLWVSSTPVDDQIHRNALKDFYRLNSDVIMYNGIADLIMKRNNIKVTDLYGFTLGLGNDLYCDHVHFKEYIRQRQGEYIASEIKKL